MFLLMERFCLTQRILLPSTVEFDESEHWKTENIPVSIFNVLDVNVLVA